MWTEIKSCEAVEGGLAQLAAILRSGSADRVSDLPRWLSTVEVTGPTLAFDLDRIDKRMRWLAERAKAHSIDCLLAVKSCPQTPYLELACQRLQGYDVSNPAEYRALPQDLGGKWVSLTSPHLARDLRWLTERGNQAVVTLDSPVQVEQFVAAGAELPYLLRVESASLVGASCGSPQDRSRFGFTGKEVEELLARLPASVPHPAGFHVHHGSESNSEDDYRAILRGVSTLASLLPQSPRFLNLGGGWHGLEDRQIETLLGEARLAFPPGCRVMIEPGRWYGEGAGFAIGTIVNTRQRPDDSLDIVLDLSRTCHLRWSSPRLICPLPTRARRFSEVRVYGPSCYEGDHIGTFFAPYERDLSAEANLLPGERMLLSNVSLYSAAWNTAFNGVPTAEVCWVHEGRKI